MHTLAHTHAHQTRTHLYLRVCVCVTYMYVCLNAFICLFICLDINYTHKYTSTRVQYKIYERCFLFNLLHLVVGSMLK